MEFKKRRLSLAIAAALTVSMTATVSAQSFPAVFELAELDGSNGFGINGLADDDRAGSISSEIDLNDDGLADIVIGAGGADAGADNTGKVYVIYGTETVSDGSFDLATLNGTNGFVINGDEAEFRASVVASAGDVNGDGIDDLLIGAPGISVDTTGKAYIIFGSSSALPNPFNLSGVNGVNGILINPPAVSDTFGRSTGGIGDFNGDGVDDVIIGDQYSDVNGSNSGRSTIIFGSNSGLPNPFESSALDGSDGFIINGEAMGDQFGSSLNTAGDINNDGINDVVISSPRANGNDVFSGIINVLYGTTSNLSSPFEISTLNGLNGFFLNGEAFGDQVGRSVKSAGDINHDGIDDLIIGAISVDSNAENAGRSYVVFGSDLQIPSPFELSSLNGINGFALDGTNEDDFSGSSVSKAGDINGDGIDDLVIGAFGVDINGVNSGRVYVVFGSDSGFANPLQLSNLDGNDGFVLNGGVDGKYAGSRVSGGGDINGDGVDDLLISSFSADTKYGENTGRTWVVFGRPSIDLSISKTNAQSFVDPEGSVTYVIDVSNPGPIDVSNAMLNDNLPPTLNSATANWSCDTATGTVCPVSGGTGNINQLIDLPAGSSLSFSITADVVASEGEVISNTASITLPGELVDADPSNNSATDSDPTGLFADSFEIDL